jgi:hypothetical protein
MERPQADFFLPLFRTNARGRRDYHVQSLLPASARLLLLPTTVAATTTLVSFICSSACVYSGVLSGERLTPTTSISALATTISTTRCSYPERHLAKLAERQTKPMDLTGVGVEM